MYYSLHQNYSLILEINMRAYSISHFSRVMSDYVFGKKQFTKYSFSHLQHADLTFFSIVCSVSTIFSLEL